MEQINHIAYVYSEDGDWYGTYFNGRLFHEGHEINGKYIVQQMAILGVSKMCTIDEYELNYCQMEELGNSCPMKLSVIEKLFSVTK